MDVAQAVQDNEQIPGWMLLVFFAIGAFCLCLGLALVRDYRGLSSQNAAAARHQDAQRLINKIVGGSSSSVVPSSCMARRLSQLS
ncbi:hypothetical protein [Streptomyces sp. NBC_00154]|uniref:hypothetical protein n=1 Tax=Streptomyces sp. NBC_00154 TaxID=2975670 RepID=UPI002259C5F0|nr:hypothetical protein [Streptomyces sp. NBC_00154]MCX5311371.1 hypothetical protein [Streptomyces sp. NBC_00154]